MREPSFSSYGARAYESAARTVSVTLQNMAIQDWLAALFHLYMWLRVVVAPDSPDAAFARRLSLVLLTVTLCTILVARGELLPAGRGRALLYRLGVFCPLVGSYLELRWLLPALQQPLLDAELMAIDEVLFGITPSIWLAQFNTYPVVEWFSFFYYSYFYILASVLLPTLFLDWGRRQQELLYGTLIIVTTGHFMYTLIPGIGPWAMLSFEKTLRGGLFFELIWSTVDQAGAMLDIFPSLHTAYPAFFAIFAFTYRQRGVYKYAWPVLAFFAVNMIIATMFLRWHWAIDVVAGLLLAFGARGLGSAFASLEQWRRTQHDGPGQPVWEPLWRRHGAD